jgi:pyrimidine-nucleoside phosphorylase
LGTAAMLLGAGRATKESEIDLAVGLVLHKKIGDKVQKGESLLTIYSNFEDVSKVQEKLYQSIKQSNEMVKAPKLIYEQITY